MNLSLSFLGTSGHSEVTFADDGAILKWSGISNAEKKALQALIVSARKSGCKTYAVDDDGRAGEESDELPGILFSRSGSLKFVGDVGVIKTMAREAIENEIKGGKIVMEAQSDGTFKIIRAGKFDLKSEAQKVVSATPLPGG